MTARHLSLALLLPGLAAFAVLGRRDLPAPAADPPPAAWAAKDRADFYHLAEGSEIFPLDWLVALKSARTGKLFVEDLGRFGFIPDDKGPEIRGAPKKRLPIGVTVATPVGSSVEMVGVNCAACHTGVITSGDKEPWVVDGAPAVLDIEAFYQEIFQSVQATLADRKELVAFLERLQKNGPRDPLTKILVLLLPKLKGKAEVDGLEKVLLDRLKSRVGGGRPVGVEMGRDYLKLLSAAGRRDAEEMAKMAKAVLEEQAEQRGVERDAAKLLLDVLKGDPKAPKSDLAKELAKLGPERFLLLEARLVFLRRLQGQHAPGVPQYRPGPGRVDAFGNARNLIFGKEDTQPASSPVRYPHLWGLGKLTWLHWDGNTNSIMERNIGQALGLGAVAVESTAQSTVLPVSLNRLELLAKKIPTPTWPAAHFGLPAVDAKKAAAGKKHYAKNCAGCHDEQKGATKTPEGSLVYPLTVIGTDPERATTFAKPMSDGKTFAQHLAPALQRIKERAYKDAKVKAADAEKMDLPQAKIKWLTTRGYVARPLAGAWAKAPYLHNGSVPTLDDLLKPADERPRVFPVGHTEYDFAKMGYVSDPMKVPEAQLGRVFYYDVRQRGNGNGGHEYGTKLSADERKELLEYLKTLR